MSSKKVSKFDRFLASGSGKIFFNRVYSWGAAVVIIGALFKILHWPYGSEILMVGMLVEALVFFISGFDNPVLREESDAEKVDVVEEVVVAPVKVAYSQPVVVPPSNIGGGQVEAAKDINDSLGRIKNLYEGSIEDSIAFKAETEKMTKQIEALNDVYARLLKAMTTPSTPTNS